MGAFEPGAALRTDYDLLDRQVSSLLEDERDFIANAANFAALIFYEVPSINWAGFYFPGDRALVLGPFGGKPACTRLPEGRGVCGAAFAQGHTVVVDDVNAFPDHVACDSASRSEIVIPLMVEGAAAGVFDIDSPLPARFSRADRAGLERLVTRFVALTTIPERFRKPHAASARLNERIDIQTCRDHHVVVRFLSDELSKPGLEPQASAALLKRLRTVLISHLKLEDDWLYPLLAKSRNEVVRHKAERYSREMGGLREHFGSLFQTWGKDGAIAQDDAMWRREWNIFVRDLRERMDNEDHDLYVTAEADIAT
jgi:GAF domain-containing protein